MKWHWQRLFAGALLLAGPGAADAGLGDFFGSIKDGVSNMATSFGRTVGLSDVIDGLDQPLIDEVLKEIDTQAGEKTLPRVPPDQLLLDVRQMRQAGNPMVRRPRLEAYLNGILKKIRLAWPGPPVAATVRLSSIPEFGGQTFEHGTIFIPLGTLVQLDNEDEVAALLGHEYSHLLLGHHQKDMLDEVQSKIFDYGELLLRMNSKGDSGTLRSYAKLRVARWGTDIALMPKWSRDQEAEADVLGTDLMIRAGYNADAMKTLLQKLGATAKKKQKIVEVAKALKINREGEELGWSVDLEKLFDTLTETLSSEFGADHEEAKARRDRVRTYLREQYPRRERPELKVTALARQQKGLKLYSTFYDAEYSLSTEKQVTPRTLNRVATTALKVIRKGGRKDPYLWLSLYEVRLRQNKPRSAHENLGLALKTGQAPITVYEKLIDLAMTQQQYAQALRYLDRMKSELGDNQNFLPVRIEAERALKHPVETLLLQCVGTGKSKLIEECNKAAGKV